MKYSRYRFGFVDQYSPAYHLSRKVLCVGCGVAIHKNHDFVLHGSRCSRCWGEYVELCNSLSAVEEVGYTVYVWLASTSVEAEVVGVVSASSVDSALEKVMVEYNVSYAFYAWVVSVDEEWADEERFDVQLSSFLEVNMG